MKSIFTNEVRAMVADTYLSYTSDIDGAEAFKRFISRPASLLDVRRDPKFIAFTDNELIDEMKLMERDIIVLFNKTVQRFILNLALHSI
ncbi:MULTISPECIES: hypothetical protein [unclassified Alteromonas]|uniref:hypothetical protein n=1 Tax=unclassified Alteromonas TaxID=2614992 RepID=UPI000B6A2616|nr:MULTISPECIES: hypothetical protein [unclassified Alteromonas]MCG7651892.1 hypothetical protein [Alteromonas sp. MmMcT2-5]NQY16229.1 hypothetical protein [Alteromonas sp.]OUX88830.1 MAG: hypothetical protein CBB95_06790 [Alteromonas sp. TMED35]|tara:strand:- start:16425 stop:16691 length:267 start_codon:yes stop_codon:yes gene_type:complete